jgi:hypothetical protein
VTPPSIILDDFSIDPDDPSMTLFAHQQSTSDGMEDISFASDPPTCDYNHSNYSNSDITTHLPPSSNAPTEVSSAVASDSELLLPPKTQSSKPTKKPGLLNFFPVIPADEAHAAWGKRKRANFERDEEERAEIMRKEEKQKEEKLADLRERNLVSQRKRRRKVKDQEVRVGVRDKDGKKLPVSKLLTLEIAKLIYFKVVTKSEPEIQVPSRAEVAATSRPKRAIMAQIKQEKKRKAGKVYRPSKRDVAPYKTVNWKSPTTWPAIDMGARQQIGMPNNSELVAELRRRDPRFNELSHRRIGEWRDNSVKDRIVWSKETLAAVKKEFLPGGHQTHYNVFVSVFLVILMHGG